MSNSSQSICDVPPLDGNAGRACASSPKLAVRGLRVRYGRTTALEGVDLDVACCRVTAIVGPSGCGKSSFLNCLNRLTDITPGCVVEGSVQLDGREILDRQCDLLGLRRRIGLVFQKPNPFPLSIRQNLVLPLREHGFPRRETEDRVCRALTEVGLYEEVHDRMGMPATQLSGGQQQRLCIARALALEPEVILFDEPCSALDPIASEVVERLIRSLARRITVVIVTHNLAQARRVADSVAVFWHRDGAGRLLEHDATTQIFTAPRDPIVADYLRGERG